MPGNGFPFAVGVGGQDDPLGALGGFGDIVQALGGLGIHIPGHRKVFIRPHRSVLGRQVADMAVAGQNRIVRPQIFVDSFSLGWALNDDKVHVRRVFPGRIARISRLAKVGRTPPSCQPSLVSGQSDAAAGREFDATCELQFRQCAQHMRRRRAGNPDQLVARNRRGRQQGRDPFPQAISLPVG